MTNSIEIYSKYDFLAKIYNRHWATFHLGIYPLLEEEILIQLEKEVEILDICCGSGHLVALLNKNGFKAAGLDGSSELLKIARSNYKSSVFYHADIRNFEMTSQYMLITCFYDSLNHLMKISELKKVFDNVFKSLKNGGIFVFDLNTEKVFLENWNGTFLIEDEASKVEVTSNYFPDTKIARMQFDIYEDTTLVTTQCIEETYFEDERIYDLLEESGFSKIKKIVTQNGRIIFIVHKK